MTTDELRTWMKALEERDVKIVALEKRLTALETAQAARAAWPSWVAERLTRHSSPEPGNGASSPGVGYTGRELREGGGAPSARFGIYNGGYYARRLEFKAGGDRWKPQATPGPCAHLTDAQLVADWAGVYPKFEWRIAPVEPE